MDTTPTSFSTPISRRIEAAAMPSEASAAMIPETLQMPTVGVEDMNRATLAQYMRNLAASKAVRQRTEPELAEIERLIKRKTLEDIKGETPPEIQRELTRAGVTSAIAGGVGTGSTAGESRLSNILTRGVLALRESGMQRGAGLLAAAGQPEVGITPASAAQEIKDRSAMFANLLNQFASDRAMARAQRTADFLTRAQQAAAMQSQEAMENVRSAQEAAAANMGLFSSLLGSAIQAGTTLGAGALAGGASSRAQDVLAGDNFGTSFGMTPEEVSRFTRIKFGY